VTSACNLVSKITVVDISLLDPIKSCLQRTSWVERECEHAFPLELFSQRLGEQDVRGLRLGICEPGIVSSTVLHQSYWYCEYLGHRKAATGRTLKFQSSKRMPPARYPKLETLIILAPAPAARISSMSKFVSRKWPV
jgi:hypothetical protein